MEDVMLTFHGKGLNNFITKDEMTKRVPFAFLTEKTNPGTSDKYVLANTETLINDMARLGWGVTDCKQQRANKRSNIRSFHTVAFQNPDIYILGTDGKIEAYPTIIVSNSHDGFHSFKFMCGVYRLVCSNGCILADAEFSSFSIRHINYDFEELERIVAQAIETVKRKLTVINDMRRIRLSAEQKKEFALRAVAIRKGVEVVKIKMSDDEVNDILTPVRTEDEGDDLWSVFNVLQEKVTKGIFALGKTKTGKQRKARPITGAAKDIEVNQGLFLAATEYLEAA